MKAKQQITRLHLLILYIPLVLEVNSTNIFLHNSRIDVKKRLFCKRNIISSNNLHVTSEQFTSFLKLSNRFINSIDLTKLVSLGY